MGLVARIRNINEPQIPVVGDDMPCPTARDVVISLVGVVRPLETVAPLSGAVLNDFRQSCYDSEALDDDVLSVGAVRPLETVAPLGGAVRIDARQPYSYSAASDNDVLSLGAWVPMNRTAVCCARLDDFDWVVPNYDPDIVLSGGGGGGQRSGSDGACAGCPCVPMCFRNDALAGGD